MPSLGDFVSFSDLGILKKNVRQSKKSYETKEILKINQY